MKVNELKKSNDRRSSHLRVLAAMFFALFLTLSAAAPALAQALSDGEGNLRVMNYNVYEGADLSPAFTTTNITDFLKAIGAILANVQATNPPARAQAIARQIGKANPTLVSLQEVTEWKTCPATADLLGCAGPPTVLYDLLILVKDALQAQGLSYREVGHVITNDLQAPAITSAGPVIVFYTQRSAIFARSDIDPSILQTSNVQMAKFDAKLTVTTGAGDFTVHRAWISTDVRFHSHTFRLIDTQLDAFNPAKNYAQGEELISGPANTSMPVVISMDSNSPPNPSSNPFTSTYNNFLLHGFNDAWTETQGDAQGLTCCQDPTLANAVSQLYQRVDQILIRGDLGAKTVGLFGGQPSDRTNGLWPSDHLGVAARLGTE